MCSLPFLCSEGTFHSTKYEFSSLLKTETCIKFTLDILRDVALCTGHICLTCLHIQLMCMKGEICCWSLLYIFKELGEELPKRATLSFPDLFIDRFSSMQMKQNYEAQFIDTILFRILVQYSHC
jgi:hypothetical protein